MIMTMHRAWDDSDTVSHLSNSDYRAAYAMGAEPMVGQPVDPSQVPMHSPLPGVPALAMGSVYGAHIENAVFFIRRSATKGPLFRDCVQK